MRTSSTYACLLSFVLAAGGTLLGCDGDDTPSGRPTGVVPAPVPLPGCEHISHAPCEIREEACQARWASVAACLRGQDAPITAPLRVVSESQYEAEIRAEMVDPDAEALAGQTALELLGMISPETSFTEDAIALRVKNTGAFYRWTDHSILVVDHGRPEDGILANSILLHELVHAAQDAELGLEAYAKAYATATDEALGARAVIEGEADLYRTLVLLAMNGIRLADVDLAAVFAARSRSRLESALEASSPWLSLAAGFPYGPGARYVHLAHASGGPTGVRSLFADPPSTRRVLLGQTDPQAEMQPIDFGTAVSVPGTQVAITDTLGAFGLLPLGATYGGKATLDDRLRLVESFRGDRLVVYMFGAATGLIWEVAFADESGAVAFGALLPVDSRRRVIQRGNGRVTVVAAETEKGLHALGDALEPPQ